MDDEFTACDWKVVIAIDLGTKYSGYAYQLKGSDEIIPFTNWEGIDGNTAYKTPTAILLNADGEFKSFGQSAIQDFGGFHSNSEDYLLFENFKMELYENAKNGNLLDLSLCTEYEIELPAMTVFSQALKFLKEHAIRNCEESCGLEPRIQEIIWVLTVPAIWQDSAKEFMRQAAREAGLVEDVNSKRLIIALEPEAAGVLCRSERTAQYPRHKGNVSLPQPGDSYLVIDVGGGTVDIAAQQLTDDNSLRQLHYAVGGAHGGGVVDEGFIDLLADVFGDEVIEDFKAKSRSAFNELKRNFEAAKRVFNGDRPMRITLPYKMFDYIKQETIPGILASYANGSDITFFDGKLEFCKAFAARLFDQVISDIISATKQVYEVAIKVAPLKVFFLVGGFAESKLLRDSLKRNFCDVAVLKPKEPGLAVLKGAVRFGSQAATSGFKSFVITHRVMSRTYGTVLSELYDPHKHGDKQTLKAKNLIREKDGRAFRIGVFKPLVVMGESVEIGQKSIVNLMSMNPKEFVVLIYCSEEDDVQYVDDPGCRKLGEVRLARKEDEGASAKGYPFALQIRFGGTEIFATIFDQLTGFTQQAPIKYF